MKRIRDSHQSTDRKKAGYTLVEVLVASTVTGLIVAGALGFYMTTYKIGFVNQERNRINADMRRFTGQLIRDGRQASYFVLYRSIDEESRDKPNDRKHDGQSGDLLVFVSTEESSDITEPSRIKEFVAYYRAPELSGDDELAPVRRYEQVFEDSKAVEIESLLPTRSEFLISDQVIELSKGLADERLFYNFWGRSVMVNGQIHHGNEAKRVTETYNFTVSPRG